MDDLEEDDVCGLDLGTTFSCIGVYRNGGVEIIPNRYGDKTTPSIVTIIDKDTILRGEETLDNLVKDYDGSIFAVKRFLGRDFEDKEVKEEMEKGNFPFKFVMDKGLPSIEVKKNNETIHFTLEEISSYVIRKMVDSAENFLEKSIDKLVITVPYNFNDAQRKCTEQAAEIAGVKVLRFINEPTAAALAYRLDEKTKDNNGKILIFDLGGGTFDVTLLSINKSASNEDIFNVLSSKGEKFLGGEDFDNILVEYFLDLFCAKMNLKKEDVKKDKKAIRKLKISCEKIKRVLGSTRETQLCINNFYDNKDILEIITSAKFNSLCKDLIEKLRKPLEDVISDAKISKKDISEIVLVGGSTKLPMVRIFITKFFNGCEIKINDSINPDEAIAYGATLMAAKISKKKIGALAGFNLMDIAPLSLGIETQNNSEDKKIRDRGLIMSVIIKRGVKIPYSNTRSYVTVSDYQTEAKIAIYEGEKKYVNENHKLGEVLMSKLTKKPRGKVIINVNFYINANGILTVTGTEEDKKDNQILIEIKNDNVNLTKEEVENLRKKNEKYQNMNPDLKLDYNNLKQTLIEFKKIYDTSKNDNEKYNILMSYNSTLEEFIDLFNNENEENNKKGDNFDNETMIEKIFFYVYDLFKSYSKTLNNSQIQDADKQNIMNKMKEYINLFISKCSGYLTELMESITDFPKKIYYEIVIYIIEQLNECGKQCLKERKKFCRYNSLTYFERSLLYYKIYISDLGNVLKNCHKKDYDNCKLQKEISQKYIEDINSDAILLCEESLKKQKLIPTGSGFSMRIKGISIGDKEEIEKNEIVLYNYEKMLASLKGKTNEEEAICLANIIKINYVLLNGRNIKINYEFAKRCEFIVKNKKLNQNSEWYKEFKEIYKKLEGDNKVLVKSENKESIRTKYGKQFDEIDDNFNKRNSNIDFIDYVLTTRPYPQYKEDKDNKKIDFTKESSELYELLTQRYHPNEYTIDGDEQSQLDYFLTDYIDSKLNNLKENY